jgi:hypothetical protein
LLEQDRPAILAPQPVVNGIPQEAPGILDAASWDLASAGLPLNRFFWQPQIIGSFLECKDIWQCQSLVHLDTSILRPDYSTPMRSNSNNRNDEQSASGFAP